MKLAKLLFIPFTMLVFGLTGLPAQSWVTAYYVGYNPQRGNLPPDSIDYSAVTHLIHFALTFDTLGNLNDTANGINLSRKLDTLAHLNGRKVLICVGGGGTAAKFNIVMNNSTRKLKFEDSLVSYVTRYNYDGIDIDWESVGPTDSNWTKLISDLRQKLGSSKLLTAAITPQTAYNSAAAQLVVNAQSNLNQINLMNYDLADTAYHKSWCNTPLYDHNERWASDTSRVLPSANGMVAKLLAAGVHDTCLGVGIDFNGWVWYGDSGTTTGGVTRPRQLWTSNPNFHPEVPYYSIMGSLWRSTKYVWDDSTKTPYLSIDNVTSSADSFVTYDDQRSSISKVMYSSSPGISGSSFLGGVMIWDLSGGYRATLAAKAKDSLLQSVKAGYLATKNQSQSGIALAGNSQRKLVRNSSNGKLYLVFESNGDIYSRTSTNNGSSWQTTNILSDGSAHNFYPCITNLGDTLYAVWQFQAGSNWNVRYVFSTNGGSSWSDTLTPLGAANFACSKSPGPAPVVQVTSPGGSFKLMIVYQDNGGLKYFVDSTTVTPSQSNWRAGSVSGAGTSAENPSIAISANTTFNLAWDDGTDSWYQTYGTSWSTPPAKITTSANAGKHCSLAIEGNGHVWATWEHMAGMNQVYVKDLSTSSYWYFYSVVPTVNLYAPVVSGHNAALSMFWYCGTYAGPSGVQKSYYNGVGWTNPGQVMITNSRMNPAISVNNPPGGTAYAMWMNSASPGYVITTNSSGGPLSKSASGADWTYSRKADFLDRQSGGSFSLEVSSPYSIDAGGSETLLDFVPSGNVETCTANNVWTNFACKPLSVSDVHNCTIIVPVAVSNTTAISPDSGLFAIFELRDSASGAVLGTAMKSLYQTVTSDSIVITTGANPTAEGLAPGTVLLTVRSTSDSLSADYDAMLGQGYHQSPAADVAKRGVKHGVTSVPITFSLNQNYPNPFNPETKIRYSLAEAGKVNLKVFDVLGREVARLVDGEEQRQGDQAVSFNAARLATGVYFYRLEAGKFSQVKKLLLIR